VRRGFATVVRAASPAAVSWERSVAWLTMILLVVRCRRCVVSCCGRYRSATGDALCRRSDRSCRVVARMLRTVLSVACAPSSRTEVSP
jgi:hypothetical protein